MLYRLFGALHIFLESICVKVQMQISLLRSLYSRCPTTVGVPNPAHCVPILGSAELEFASVVMQECVELSFMSHGTFLMEIFERFFFS